MFLFLLLLQLLRASENHTDESLQDIRLFSLFQANSDMLWYDLRGVALPWSVPSQCSNILITVRHTSVAYDLGPVETRAGTPFLLLLRE